VAIEREAAEAIAARIAEGRPPAAVWSAAERRRAAKGLPSNAWYGSSPGRTLPPVIGADLVLRVVRLPLAPGPRAKEGKRKAAVPSITAATGP